MVKKDMHEKKLKEDEIQKRNDPLKPLPISKKKWKSYLLGTDEDNSMFY